MTEEPGVNARAMSLGGHPAKFSPGVMEVIVKVVQDEIERTHNPNLNILDPFAGVGGIHALRTLIPGVSTLAVEIEREWAFESSKLGPTIDCDFLKFGDMKWDKKHGGPDEWHGRTYANLVVPEECWIPGLWINRFDVICVSPAYGNRMADSHEAKDLSRRVTYTHRLGRKLSPNNSGAMQWGEQYREFHIQAWTKVYELLVDGGLFVLNVSDHIRGGVKQPVVAWHEGVCRKLGFVVTDNYKVGTRRMKMGENREARVDGERVLVMRKGKP